MNLFELIIFFIVGASSTYGALVISHGKGLSDLKISFVAGILFIILNITLNYLIETLKKNGK